jgi:hypothetical protein
MALRVGRRRRKFSRGSRRTIRDQSCQRRVVDLQVVMSLTDLPTLRMRRRGDTAATCARGSHVRRQVQGGWSCASESRSRWSSRSSFRSCRCRCPGAGRQSARLHHRHEHGRRQARRGRRRRRRTAKLVKRGDLPAGVTAQNALSADLRGRVSTKSACAIDAACWTPASASATGRGDRVRRRENAAGSVADLFELISAPPSSRFPIRPVCCAM